jgi:hypothetical protein
MGQAKNRGSFEERKNASVAAKAVRQAQYEADMRERERNMTDAQRYERHQTRKKLSLMCGLALSHSPLFL